MRLRYIILGLILTSNIYTKTVSLPRQSTITSSSYIDYEILEEYYGPVQFFGLYLDENAPAWTNSSDYIILEVRDKETQTILFFGKITGDHHNQQGKHIEHPQDFSATNLSNSVHFFKERLIHASPGFDPNRRVDRPVDITITYNLDESMLAYFSARLPLKHDISFAPKKPTLILVDRVLVDDPFNENTVIQASVGSRVDIKIDKITFRDHNINIEGLPGLWVARFGWDVMYYRTTSVQPNTYKPFLGFDSQVHSLLLRRYKDYFGESDDPSGYKIKEDDWVEDGDYMTWTYYIQDAMSSNRKTYSPQVNWQVKKEKGAIDASTGKSYKNTQQHDQRRGANMFLLNSWENLINNEGEINNEVDYTGPEYTLGLDPDELLHLNGEATALSVNGYSWHKTLTAEKNSRTALSLMVTAYQKNRSRFLEGYPLPQSYRYEGYEVEDRYRYIKQDGSPCEGGTDCYYVSGNSSNNGQRPRASAAPGLVKIKIGDEENDININAQRPFHEEAGFYGRIRGTEYPTVYEENVPYTLINLRDISPSELKKYAMVLEYEDHLGILHKQRHNLKDLSDQALAEVDENNSWTVHFDIKGFGSYNISVLYQKEAGYDEVIVAGKELNEIELRFMAVNEFTGNQNPKKYDEKRGPGAFWYLQDVINEDGKEGTRPYARSYTIHTHQHLEFNVTDSDPHTFRTDDIEFYKSNRAKAKRIHNDSLSTSLQWYVNEVKIENGELIYLDQGHIIGNKPDAKYNDYQFENPGQYLLTANYRGYKLSHLIKVVPYTYDKADDKLQKGIITRQALTSKEHQWALGLIDYSYQDSFYFYEHLQQNSQLFEVLSVDNVLSSYQYADAPRGEKSLGRYKNYLDQYTWNITSSNSESLMDHVTDTDLGTFNQRVFTEDWVQHFDGDNSLSGNYFKSSEESGYAAPPAYKQRLDNLREQSLEPWNIRFPWIAKTEFQGSQIRNNIKSVFHMPSLFDNLNGAFSGTGIALTDLNDDNEIDALDVPPSILYPIAPDQLSKDMMEEQKFYSDLITGRKLVRLKPIEVLAQDNIVVTNEGNFIASINETSESKTLLKGVDISSLSILEDNQYKFQVPQSFGSPQEILPRQWLKDIGANIARVHTWVNPKYTSGPENGKPYPYNNTLSTKTEVEKLKAAGIPVLLDIMYSDTWSNAGAQVIPYDWRVYNARTHKYLAYSSHKEDNPGFMESKEMMYEYTKDLLESIHASENGVKYVQIGNELINNMLMSRPLEEYLDPNDKTKIAIEFEPYIRTLAGKSINDPLTPADLYKIHWDRQAVFMNEAIRAIREYDSEIKILFHINEYQSLQSWIQEAMYSDTYGRLGTATVKDFDIMGVSLYLGEDGWKDYWSEKENRAIPFSLDAVMEEIEWVKKRYGKDVLIVETNYPHTENNSDELPNFYNHYFAPGSGTDTQEGKAWPAPMNIDNQREWFLTLQSKLQATNGALGALIYEPFYVGNNIQQKDWVGSSWDNAAFFSQTYFQEFSLNPRGSVNFFDINYYDQWIWDEDLDFTKATSSAIEEGALEVKELEEDTNFVIYPNPNQGKFQIAFGLKDSSPALLKIFSISGVLIFEQHLELKKGNHRMHIDLPETTAEGTYIINLQTNEFTKKETVIIR